MSHYQGYDPKVSYLQPVNDEHITVLPEEHLITSSDPPVNPGFSIAIHRSESGLKIQYREMGKMVHLRLVIVIVPVVYGLRSPNVELALLIKLRQRPIGFDHLGFCIADQLSGGSECATFAL